MQNRQIYQEAANSMATLAPCRKGDAGAWQCAEAPKQTKAKESRRKQRKAKKANKSKGKQKKQSKPPKTKTKIKTKIKKS